MCSAMRDNPARDMQPVALHRIAAHQTLRWDHRVQHHMGRTIGNQPESLRCDVIQPRSLDGDGIMIDNSIPTRYHQLIMISGANGSDGSSRSI